VLCCVVLCCVVLCCVVLCCVVLCCVVGARKGEGDSEMEDEVEVSFLLILYIVSWLRSIIAVRLSFEPSRTDFTQRCGRGYR